MPKQKPDTFLEEYAKKIDRNDPLCTVKFRYLMDYKKPNFALNSLGAPHCNAPRYVNIFMKHWEENQVSGHMIPMKGIGNNPTGYANFREMFRPYAIRLLGAHTASETAIVNDQSSLYCSLFRWLAEKQLRNKRTVILYERDGVFPSDGPIIQETVRIINLNFGTTEGQNGLSLVPIPQTELGLIDHDKLLELIEEIGENLAVVAFGSGGIHWKTAQLLDTERIGPAVKKVGGKTLVNIAHALGIVDLKLHEHQITAAVGCTYKFMGAGAGGPSLVFIHEDEDTDTLLPIGWFSHESPINALQGISSPLKKGAQRIEASNPNVLGWLPFYAAAEEYYRWTTLQLQTKGITLLTYFDEIIAGIQNNFDHPIEIITPANERSTEIVFTTKNRATAPLLHRFINEHGVICDIRDKERIRIGMYPLISTHSDLNKLGNTMWEYFEQ